VVLVAVVAIAVVTAGAQRLNVAGPLLLVGVGILVSLLPFVHMPTIAPGWILVGVLPPLLYSSAVNLPAIEFRRDLRPIFGLSVLLVILSSFALGVFFWLAIPAVGLPLGIALGAILSPTDAVATTIAKRLGIAPRVITMLEGESLLNDATALVMMRTAIAAIAGSFSLWGAIGTFFLGVIVAVIIGAIGGWVMLRIRAWVRSSAANTAISFTVPFLVYLPTEHLGGSGLVAVVVAGIVTGQGAARRLTPEQRLSDRLNWSTIELVLEGAVFLLMGLEIKDIVAANLADHEGLWHPLWLALVALAIVLVVRGAYVTLLVWLQSRRARRLDRGRLEEISRRLDAFSPGVDPWPTRLGPAGSPARQGQRVETLRARVARTIADTDYYQSSPIGGKHGILIVWAGMRGVVTLAAAQTLTQADTGGHRALLVLIAFIVALVSLLMQGLTLPAVVRMLRLDPAGAAGGAGAAEGGAGAGDGGAGAGGERDRMYAELNHAAALALADPALTDQSGTPFSPALLGLMEVRLTAPRDDDGGPSMHALGELRLAMIDAMRTRLGELSSGGTFSSAGLRRALAELDAEQLSLELRLNED
jgi:NhaP-type Na+/H+ or K+/H+ antiporter